jgi:hypothetical protein
MTFCPIYVYGSTALCWALAAFAVSWSFTQSVGLLGQEISPSQGRYLHTGQHEHRINAHKYPSFKLRFEPTIPVFERANRVHALDRAATAIDLLPTTYLKNSVPISQKMHCVSVTRNSCLIGFVEIIPVYPKKHTKHVNKLCGQYYDLFVIKVINDSVLMG